MLLRRVLLVVLFLAVFPPLLMWVLAVFDRGTLLSFLRVAATPESRTVGLYFGLAAGGVGAAGLLAASWILRARDEGLTLATLVGAMMAAGGVAMLALGAPTFGVLDLAKGSLVVVLARAARRAP
jgi:hypothetical protein